MKSTNDFYRKMLDAIRYNFGELMVINILWVLLMIPIITIPPAFAGLYYATYQITKDEPASRETFFRGFKLYFRQSYGWFIVNLFLISILLINIDISVRVSQAAWLRALSGVFLIFLMVWLLLQIHSFPLMLQQDEPKFFLSLKNSAILWFKNVVFNFSISAMMAVLVLISIYLFPFWFLITGSLLAYLANLATVFHLSKETKLSDKYVQ